MKKARIVLIPLFAICLLLTGYCFFESLIEGFALTISSIRTYNNALFGNYDFSYYYGTTNYLMVNFYVFRVNLLEVFNVFNALNALTAYEVTTIICLTIKPVLMIFGLILILVAILIPESEKKSPKVFGVLLTVFGTLIVLYQVYDYLLVKGFFSLLSIIETFYFQDYISRVASAYGYVNFPALSPFIVNLGRLYVLGNIALLAMIPFFLMIAVIVVTFAKKRQKKEQSAEEKPAEQPLE